MISSPNKMYINKDTKHFILTFNNVKQIVKEAALLNCKAASLTICGLAPVFNRYKAV